MMKRIVLLILLSGVGLGMLRAQHQEVCEPPIAYKGKAQPAGDTVSVLSAFKKGNVNGHFRYFLMGSDNAGELTDYIAHAGGGGIRFETAAFRGVQFAIGGSYVFNMGSPDFTLPDSTAGAFNRYEVGLYDIDHPEKKKDLDRLEELYLQYNWRKSALTFGRQLINTPFINLQDGRMRPTAVEGAVLRWAEIRNLTIESGFLYAISPRSTVNWYSIENSIGLYPSGVNPDGSKSDYRGRVRSAGIGYVGLTKKLRQPVSFQLWDVWVDKVMNTLMVQADLVKTYDGQHAFTAAAQFIRQDGIGHGGHEERLHTYFPATGRSMAFGLSAGYRKGHITTSVHYTRITAAGRYLMPREWGRDPLFTFMPRERNEGLGDVHAVVARVMYKVPVRRYSVALAAGYFELPDVKDTRLNKYGMPSYAQINLDLRYTFGGLFEGLDVQYLLATKINAGETYDQAKYVFNKVDMKLHNLVLNYHF